MKPIRRLIAISIISLIMSTPSFAVFDFPLGYKLAIYDAYEIHCKSATPEAFEKWAKKMRPSFGEATKEQKIAAKKDKEYKFTRDQIIDYFKESSSGISSKKIEECLEILNRNN